MKFIFVTTFMLFFSTGAYCDEFDKFRAVIDKYTEYSLGQGDKAIHELESFESDDVEKHYLLGMLYTIQGIKTMVMVAKTKPKKPKVEEVLAEPAVRQYFLNAEKHYDEVENGHAGYKYIYCKYAELYRYSFNDGGLVSITKKIGKANRTEATKACEGAIENIAAAYAELGRGVMSRSIFLAAIENWDPYPEYMLEAMGDLDAELGDTASAKKWWKRCVNETAGQRKERCQMKANE